MRSTSRASASSRSPIVSSVSIECYDSGATVVVVPKAETRPVFAYQPQGALKYDYTHPESWGIADLLGAVHHQLPAAGINVVCLGLGDRYAFEDAELALFGEPDLLGTRTGGLFANATSTALSAVLAFSLTPFGMDGTSADASVRLFSTPVQLYNCGNPGNQARERTQVPRRCDGQ